MCDTLGRILSDGHALFAKNSDRDSNEPQVVEYIPRQKHKEETVKCSYIEVKQVKTTYALVLSRPSWLWGGEMGVNEYGVVIGNEAVYTKFQTGEEHLTGMDILRLALERSKTAKEAVGNITSLLETYGQGGNCSFEGTFLYDNSFLVMDFKELYVVETAGRHWVYKKFRHASISNGLSIHEDGDGYDVPCDFATTYRNKPYNANSNDCLRRNVTAKYAAKAENVQDMFEALRSHSHSGNAMACGSTTSVCMHAGSDKTKGSTSTQSMVVELKDKEITIWLTGKAMPCVSLFKPHKFEKGVHGVIQKAGDENVKNYWLRSEAFNRKLVGKVVPEEYYKDRDDIEKKLVKLVDRKDESFTDKALKMEAKWLKKYEDYDFKDAEVKEVFKKYWAKENNQLERI